MFHLASPIIVNKIKHCLFSRHILGADFVLLTLHASSLALRRLNMNGM